MKKNILVYLGAFMPNDPIYVDAVREMGREIARRGWNLVFGGSREGTMTILADAVRQHGGTVTGVFTKTLPMEFLYQNATEMFITETLAERKEKMLSLADMVIALPGSFGTWDELFNALELAKIEVVNHRPAKPIGVLNLKGYYDGLLALLKRSVETEYTTAEFVSLLKEAPTVTELLEKISPT